VKRLKAHGIRARPARNTALMDLANQLPTTVISRLLGLSIRTAARWSAEAGHLRAGYAAELAAQAQTADQPADG
jgi:transposase-like protein